MKIRIRFEKWGVMQYVGHLDMMRFFQKAFRRSHLPIKYTEGFNPHPVMSFAQPLGLGVTSSGEYMDIEITEPVTSAEALQRLNAEMVDGVRAASWKELPDKTPNAMASVAAADYVLTWADPENAPSEETLSEAIRKAITEADAICVTKETKKGTRDLDLKPLIYAISAQQTEEGPAVSMCISASSADAVKPQLVMQVIFDAMGLDPQDPKMRMHIHRADLYAGGENGLKSLDSMGKDVDECKDPADDENTADSRDFAGKVVDE